MDTSKNKRELRANMEEEEKAAQRPRGIRESLYGHIHVSVRTMNIIICVLVLLLIASIAIGMTQGER